jgi:cell division protein FtsA
VVLTGGGSLIPGTAELATEVLELDVRLGKPMGLGGGLVAEVSDPKFATGVGLVLYGLRPEMIGGTPFRGDAAEHAALQEEFAGEKLVNRIAGRMKAWFDGL